jgi:hypothetical protein
MLSLGLIESADHIFFGCHIAKMIWAFLGEIFNQEVRPSSMKNLSETWLQVKGPLPIRLILFIFAGFAWAIWNNRNKMAIEKKFPNSPDDIIYTELSVMQKRSMLLKEDDGQRIKQVKERILHWMKHFKPAVLMSTDIHEI